MVSVVIPVFNGEKYIAEALCSVCAQTYRNIEVVVVDDGSSDRTEQICSKVKSSYPNVRIKCVRHPENRGLAAARNSGLQESRGDWIAFLDHDDLWDPWHLETMVALMHTTQADMGVGSAAYFDGLTGEVLGMSDPDAHERSQPVAALFRRNFAVVSGVVITRKVAAKVGGFRRAPTGCEDYDYWLRVARSGGAIAFAGNRSVRYRVSSRQMSSNASYMAEGVSLAIRLNLWGYPSPLFGRLMRASAVFEALGFACYFDNPAKAARAFSLAWGYQPFYIRRLWLAAKCSWRSLLQIIGAKSAMLA